MEDGWVALLQKAHPEHHWVNASISGDTTQDGLGRLAEQLTLHEPDLLIIELGANDGLRGLPVNLVSENLQQMINQGKSLDARILLLGIQIPSNYGPRYTQAFANLYLELADKNRIGLVPFFLEAIAGSLDYFQADQLHPTADAQPLIAKTVWPALKHELDSLTNNKASRRTP